MSQLPGMWPEKPVGDKSHGSKLPGYQTPWPGAETGETLKNIDTGAYLTSFCRKFPVNSRLTSQIEAGYILKSLNNIDIFLMRG